MSFPIIFYNLAKKQNSTKRPTASGNTYQCILKDSCDVSNPTIILEAGLSVAPVTANYCYIEDFHRYYKVNSWTFKDRLWEASLSVDTLASFKDQIGDKTVYVNRAANEKDGAITDSWAVIEGDCHIAKVDGGFLYDSHNFSSGCFIVGIIGEHAGTVGGINYFVCSPSQFSNLVDLVLTNASDIFDDAQTGLTNFENVLAKLIMKPQDFIVSAVWLPYAAGDIISNCGASAVSNIPFGAWTENTISGNVLTGTKPYERMHTFTIPKHPQAATRGKYLNNAPYNSYSIYFPPFGHIDLTSDKLINCDQLVVDLQVDVITGGGVLEIFGFHDDTTIPLAMISSQVGIPVSLSADNSNINAGLNAAGSVVTSVTSAITGNAAGAAASVLAGVGSGAEFSQSTPQTIGASGSIAALGSGKVILCHKYFDVAADDNQNQGRPLCKNRKISTLKDFMMIDAAELEFTGILAPELAELISIMQNGFYYE